MTQEEVVAGVIDALVRLVRELEPEFYVSEEAAREAVRLQRLFNAIHLATGFKVDLVIKKDRPFSEAELARRTRGTLAGRLVSFASAEDTILAKLEWSRDAGSDRQYADALGIIQLHGAALASGHPPAAQQAPCWQPKIRGRLTYSAAMRRAALVLLLSCSKGDDKAKPTVKGHLDIVCRAGL